ncbi:MAG: hypothetical protein KAU95_01050, partial [Candidatus Aenigmarchaeota archaeon]|nr:hypothetical protein [Candidatus Aenigmarchaeota archaeon]
EILMHYQSEFSKYNSTEWRFYDNVTNLTDGSYSYYGWANDTAGNSGKTDSGNLRYLTVETISPAITLISPPDNEVDYDKNITFNYNVTDDSDIINCSLILNGILNQTNSSITKDTMQNFTLNNLALGDYIWSINCTDASNNIGASETRIVFSEVAITEFSGDTTDLTQIENLSNITNLIFDQPDYGKINFSEIVDLSSGGDINSYVNISQNRIEIDSTVLPVLNKAARLRLYNLTFTNPRILKDGIVCSDCAEVSYSGGIFVFDVTSFSTYSTEETPMTIEETLSYLGGGYPIYKPTQEQLKEGYEKILKKNWKIKFKVNNEYHQLKVDSVGDKTVAITVSSTPQQAILSIGEEKKFEVTGDNYYDFYVKLNSITNNAANLIIKKIHEEKVCEEKTKRCYTNLLQQCLDNSWQLIQTCEFSCNESLLKCNPKPTGKICNLGEKRCLGNELQECRNNNWVAIETCEHGCNSSGLACSSKQTVAEPEKLNYLIYFLVILIIGGISSVVYINRKNTEKFRESKEELKKKIQGNRKQNKQTKTGRKRCNKNRRRIKSSKK